MFIEFTEYLRCTAEHDPTWLVLAPEQLEQRHVHAGTLACPACGRMFPIVNGVVRFGHAEPVPPRGPLPAADVVQALIGLESPGGYVMLVGSAGGLYEGLSALMAGVHFVAVNPPGPVAGASLTVLESPEGLPVRERTVRGVVLGAEVAHGPMLLESRRVVLNGQRVVALDEAVVAPAGLEEMARGQGMWVGKRIREGK